MTFRALQEAAATNPAQLNTRLKELRAVDLVAHEGERYRDSLKALAAQLGVSDNIRFVDAFVENEDLLDYLQAADIYATPYLNPAQITSGTLSYAVGVGKPVISTPYVHATEILADHHGVLVDFGDSSAFAREIDAMLAWCGEHGFDLTANRIDIERVRSGFRHFGVDEGDLRSETHEFDRERASNEAVSSGDENGFSGVLHHRFFLT